ncbi:MAG: CAAX prenyl protease-related protein [bacterium]
MQSDRKIVVGHVAPFVLWIGVIFVLQGLEMLGWCPRMLYPWSYAVKAVACAALLLWLKPWETYSAFNLSTLPLAIFAGMVVTVAWVLPETPWLGRVWPAAQLFYNKWCVMMPGELPSYYHPDFFPALPPGHASLAFSPSEAGWPLTIMKLIGSACVIAVIEEFFFRGFFYRWLRQGKFWTLPLNLMDTQTFWTVAIVFGLEHDRWLAGIFAGVVYGWLTVRTGNIWCAAIAHVVTNLILGLYVIHSGQYGFW